MTVRIETIEDVLPHISYDDGIHVSKRRNFNVVDYAFVTDNTFANPVACECRGLKFDLEGRILARPFHKFFNVGEREAPEKIEWHEPHVVMDKLDGSMIHPCVVDGELVLMTRGGISPQAEAALAAADQALLGLCRELLESGTTPIFEFTSPENRIVLAYEETCLTLLAARETISGAYASHETLVKLGSDHGVPVVGTLEPVRDYKTFIAGSRAMEGVEGYVIAFDSGKRVKLKADAYVLRHKALEGVAYEKNLLAWIADDALDDVLPLLPDEIANRVRAYEQNVIARSQEHLSHIAEVVEAFKDAERKDFAMAVREKVDKRLQGIAFAIRDGNDGRAVITEMLRRASGSENRVEHIRDLFKLEWQGVTEIADD